MTGQFYHFERTILETIAYKQNIVLLYISVAEIFTGKSSFFAVLYV